MPATVKLVEALNQDIGLTLPITPAQINETAMADPRSFRVVGKGNHSFPHGRTEHRYQLTGYFPGKLRVSNPNSTPDAGSGPQLPHIHDWREPQSLVDQIKGWMVNRTKLLYLVDSLAGVINMPVYISQYTFTRKGPAGDITFDVAVVEWRTLTVAIDDGTDASQPSSNSSSDDGSGDQTEDTPTQYEVQPGDTLSYIAKQYLGDAGRWHEIYDANTDVIGDNPNVIIPGQVLNIPGGTVADPNTDGYAPMGSDATENTADTNP
jgi:LysM repeat protein